MMLIHNLYYCANIFTSEYRRSHATSQAAKADDKVGKAHSLPFTLRRPAELHETFSARRPSRRVIAVLGNITRATPSGVTRFPAGHRLLLKNSDNNISNVTKQKASSTLTNPSPSSPRSRQFNPAFRHNVRFKTKALLPSSSQISISPSKASKATSSSSNPLSPAPQSVLPADNSRVPQKTTPKISTKGKKICRICGYHQLYFYICVCMNLYVFIFFTLCF